MPQYSVFKSGSYVPVTQADPPPVNHDWPAQVFMRLLGVLGLILGGGNRVEPPFAFAGLGVVGIDESANAVLGAADADDDLALHDQRSDRGTVGHLVDVFLFLAVLAVGGDGFVPDFFAGVLIEADQMGVERRHVKPIAIDGKTAVDGIAAERQILRQRFLIMPQLRPGLAVDRIGMVPGRRDVHDAVDDQRRAFETIQHAGLEGPQGLQSRDVLLVDLLQAAVAMGVVRAVVHQPIAVVLLGSQ